MPEGLRLVLEGNPGINLTSCAQGEQTFGPTTVSMVDADRQSAGIAFVDWPPLTPSLDLD